MNDAKELLVKLGICLDTQDISYNLKNVKTIIGMHEFLFLKINNSFMLKNIKSNLFMYYSNQNLDFVNSDDSETFKKNSQFTILSDNICCSILPSSNLNYIVCMENKSIKLKKIITCFSENTLTIFRIKNYKPIVISKPVNKPIQPIKKNLIKINNLSDSFSKIISNLEIVTPNFNLVPDSLKSYCYYKNNLTQPSSICYLNYIINNYDNKLINSLLFIDKYPSDYTSQIIEKEILKGEPKYIFTYLNHRVTIDGLRYKYLNNEDNTWSAWHDITKSNQLSQISFLKKNIKILPSEKYLAYNTNNFYYISFSTIKKKKKKYFSNLLYFLQNNRVCLEYLDRCWYHILK